MEEGIATIKGKEQHPSSFNKNYIKSTFNLMLDYALEYEIVDRNYARTFSLPEEVIKDLATAKQGHIAFTDEEMQILWDHVDDEPYVDALLIQCYSGWRPQELGALELEDVDLENWTFKGGMKTESGIDRMVPIHSRIKPIVLRKYKEAEGISSKYLFNVIDPTRVHKPTRLSYDCYKRKFVNIKTNLKLNMDHRPHDGRTHFVTIAKKAGVDEYAIKYIVGHSVNDLTEKVYTKREFEWLREEIEKIK